MVFKELELNVFVNVECIESVMFEEDSSILGDSCLNFTFLSGDECNFSLFELEEDEYLLSRVCSIMEELRLYSLLSILQSSLAILKRVNY